MNDWLQWALVAGIWAVALLLLYGAVTKGPGMKIDVRLPGVSDHFSEIMLLAIIAIGVIYLAGAAIRENKAGEASAWTAVLMAIINAIKERWTQRSLDRMGASLANAPPSDPPTLPGGGNG